MRRFLLLSGIAAGLSLALGVGVIEAQGGGEAQYVGAQECRSCHQGIWYDHADSIHTLALQNVEADQRGLVADFDAGQDVRTVQFPGEDTPRPFTADDVAYVMGAGRHEQRYVYRAADGALIVLPAQWNVARGEWEPFALAEAWPDAAYAWGPNCARCHTVGLDSSDFSWVDDGVQCEACHGPGGTHLELAEAAGVRPTFQQLRDIRGSIINRPDAQLCGQCHSTGVDPTHDLPYPVEYRPGGDLLDETVFSLYPPDDAAHWWPTGHASQVAMQFNEWLQSAHASAPDALREADYADADDTCLRCHSADYRYVESILPLFEEGTLRGDPPEPVTLETAQFGITCTVCHNPHRQTDLFLVDEPLALCAGCHQDAALESGPHHPAWEMVEGVTLVEAVAGIPSSHTRIEDGPDCLTCHMPRVPVPEGDRASHALRVVLPGAVTGAAPDTAPNPAPNLAPGSAPNLEAGSAGPEDACTACHTEQADATDVQQVIDAVQASTAARLEAARAAASGDSPDWALAALDFVAGDGSGGIHNYLYTDALLDAAEVALGVIEPPASAPGSVAPTEAELEAVAAQPAAADPTVARVILLTLGAVALGVAGYGFFLKSGNRWRVISGVALVGSVALAVGAVALPGVYRGEATGEDGYCQVCHARTARAYRLADGNLLSLNIHPQAVADSVHGNESEIGRLGCVDCHGADAFPHTGPAPVSLRAYRLDMSAVCADCHQGQLEHYQDVLARNISVGCADCHTAHYVRPAEELP